MDANARTGHRVERESNSVVSRWSSVHVHAREGAGVGSAAAPGRACAPFCVLGVMAPARPAARWAHATQIGRCAQAATRSRNQSRTSPTLARRRTARPPRARAAAAAAPASARSAARSSAADSSVRLPLASRRLWRVAQALHRPTEVTTEPRLRYCDLSTSACADLNRVDQMLSERE